MAVAAEGTWTSGDVGNPDSPGSSTTSSGTFTVSGTGEDIWDTADQFRFVYQQLQGDVEVIARVNSLQGPDIWSKGGVMIRGSLSGSAPNMLVAATIGSGWTFQRRRVDGGISYGPGATKPGTAPGWVRITRQGNQLSGYTSTDGSTWTLFNSDTIAMPSTVYVGLAVTAHSPTGQATAVFSNVTARPLSQRATRRPRCPSLVRRTEPHTAHRPTCRSPRRRPTATVPCRVSTSMPAARSWAAMPAVRIASTGPPWPPVAYSLTAVAVDNGGASTTSGAVNVTVSGTVSTPTTVVFNPSPDHAALVSSYTVALFRSGDPVTATPVATKNLAKPSPVNNEISASITDIVNPLPAGSYYAVVTAVGPGGSAQSSPSASFTK